MNLLPFGQPVEIKHEFMKFETGWITNVASSYFNGHNWQYEIRTDRRLRSGDFLWGGEWFDEMDIKTIAGNVLPKMLNVIKPKFWPPKAMIGRRPGIWGINGQGVNQEFIDKMLSWNPGAITCFYDYMQANGIGQYRNKYPNVPIIIRFQHDKNWHENPLENARNKSKEIISKWDIIKNLGDNTYCYFANEMNLHYENGDENPANQYLYTTPEFYKEYALWVSILADIIKQSIPEFPLVCPPFAYGHKEDGEPDENGIPKLGWCGYEYLVGTIKTHFNNIICGHYYWGNAQGSNHSWLYGDDSKWHAYRWRKVLNLFENYFNNPVKMIIDECGNFATEDEDFTNQLIHYAENTLIDEDIIALTYFLFDDPTNSPGNMPNSWQKVPNLDAHLEAMKNMPDVHIVLPGEPPPEPPPPVEPEPPSEPPQPSQNIKMTIERGEGLHLIVGNWLEPNVELLFSSPSGNEFYINSGTKPEYGKGGFEIYAPENGLYALDIDNYLFEIPMEGQFTKLHFEYSGEPIPVKVRLISDWLDEEESENIYTHLNELYPGLFDKFEE